MEKKYPQEYVGTTLLEVESAGEYRRVFMRPKLDCYEVGEFTKGPLTQSIYNAPAHLHCIHVQDCNQDELQAFFGGGEPMLSDLMDELDTQGVPYGYLNSMMGQYVSYRPALGL